MSKFSVYVDGDAAKSQTKISRPTVHGNKQRGIVGKSFTSNVFQGGQRKALGEVNRNCQDKKLQDLNKPAPMKKLALMKKKALQIEQTTEKESVTQLSSVKRDSQLKKKENSYEEIECMFPYDAEKEDDFEDIYPKAERPSTHIKEFFECRPQSVFSSHQLISRDNAEYDPFEKFKMEEEPVRDVHQYDVLEELHLSTENLFAELL